MWVADASSPEPAQQSSPGGGTHVTPFMLSLTKAAELAPLLVHHFHPSHPPPQLKLHLKLHLKVLPTLHLNCCLAECHCGWPCGLPCIRCSCKPMGKGGGGSPPSDQCQNDQWLSLTDLCPRLTTTGGTSRTRTRPTSSPVRLGMSPVTRGPTTSTHNAVRRMAWSASATSGPRTASVSPDYGADSEAHFARGQCLRSALK